MLLEMNTGFDSSTFEPIDTAFSAILMPILGVLAVIGMYMHYLVLRMSKRDKSLMNCLLPDMALNILVGVPVVFTLLCMTIFLSDPAKEVYGIWFCHAASIIVYVWLFKMWLFSLLMSLLRYLYVVQNGKLRDYGMARIEIIFIILSWAVPAGLMALHVSLRTDYDPSPWVNHCYGWPSESSSASSWWYKVERRFCAYNDYGISNSYIEYGLRVVCGVNVGATILLFSNLAEAFVYFRIYAHLKT